MKRSAALTKRLSSYWKLEAGAAVLIPVVMWHLAEGRIGWGTLAALPAMMLLLLIGACYWRAKLRQLEGDAQAVERAMPLISQAEPVVLALTVMAVAGAAGAWLVPVMSAGPADRWCAAAAAGLAVLEYINYYHRQLQHFDHAEDFRRLITGRGFRVSQMRADLNRWRSRAKERASLS